MMSTSSSLPCASQDTQPRADGSLVDVRDITSFYCTVFPFKADSMQFVRGAVGQVAKNSRGSGSQVYVDLFRATSGSGHPTVSFSNPGETKMHIPLAHVQRLSPKTVMCCPLFNGATGGSFSSVVGTRIAKLPGQDHTGGSEASGLPGSDTPSAIDAIFGLEFQDEATANTFFTEWGRIRNQTPGVEGVDRSVAGVRTVPNKRPMGGHMGEMDASVVETYFQYYGKMANQMNMLQDTVRTTTYQRAIVENRADFEGKVVMDVGAGSGILSFFAAQAGAKKVYAVEASNMAATLALLCQGNPVLGNRIQIINKPLESIEDSEVPEKVDVLISEPIGTLLFNERMIETYLSARDRFLKPGGKMFPSKCSLYVAPFADYVLHSDMMNKCNFWKQTQFCGVDLSNALEVAMVEQFRQPIVDYIDPSLLLAPAHYKEFDFTKISRKSLEEITIDFSFTVSSPTLVHGVAGWFDVVFEGSEKIVSFSTSPYSPPTHWFQSRVVMRHPLAVNPNQPVFGRLHMRGNKQQSYFLDVLLALQDCNVSTSQKNVDLKDPDYRYYTNPGHSYFPNGQQVGYAQAQMPASVPAAENAFASAQWASFSSCASQLDVSDPNGAGDCVAGPSAGLGDGEEEADGDGALPGKKRFSPCFDQTGNGGRTEGSMSVDLGVAAANAEISQVFSGR
ncbi:protein arginine methyltransferase, related [Neospora caninum Liverpool]|uniref:type I protein arginine methyltransferase n=1 Tax=Neospora caninum (strain Liverpool) TaxID=572307 RepID=F0V7B7_NEOCL|nr:protein arginine methyltransferase, related [Neospora caninum Liverpool]CBZ49608.1 protein arginine methyltransferase, related [Neospora caninum Liverpool]CEL64188.1 TPA: Protein arginine methyltransferase, related [Neospora caninum Liverpool]|eukprot:XP_003879643.1 protein arginine methyltransferase, related [Neospora caninum Liverpool]